MLSQLYSPWALSLTAAVPAIAMCLLVTVAHFVMEPIRWNLCYLPIASDPQTRHRVSDSLFCTALATYLLPFKLGVPLRIALLQKKAGLTLHFIGVMIALDGLISLAVWSSLAAASVAVAALHWDVPVLTWGISLLAIAVVLGIYLLRTQRTKLRLKRFEEALAQFDRPWRRVSMSAAILIVDVLSYGLRHALLVLLVVGSGPSLITSGAIGITATFAGIASGLPMGLIGYDATLVALLTFTGVTIEQAVLIALFNRMLNLLSAAVMGLPAAIRLDLGSNLLSILRKFREFGHEK